MPGSSLWLVPPENSPLNTSIQHLIDTLPALFPSAKTEHFVPHLTLTSNVVIPEDSPPQAWLDSIAISATIDLRILLRAPEVGQIKFKRITLRAEKTVELCALAGACRAAGQGPGGGMDEAVKAWVDGEYAPHVSLLYSDMPAHEAEARINDIRAEVPKARAKHLGSGVARGAAIWLVPTSKPVSEWTAIAVRELPDVQWVWGGE